MLMKDIRYRPCDERERGQNGYARSHYGLPGIALGFFPSPSFLLGQMETRLQLQSLAHPIISSFCVVMSFD